MKINTAHVDNSTTMQNTISIMPWSTEIALQPPLVTKKAFHRIMFIVKTDLDHIKVQVYQDDLQLMWASEVLGGSALSASVILSCPETIRLEVENKTAEQGVVQTECIIETFAEPDVIDRLADVVSE